jgi:hypothetical protein
LGAAGGAAVPGGGGGEGVHEGFVADEEAFEIVAGVAAGFQPVVEFPHEFGGGDGDGGLFAVAAAAAEDEGEGLDMFGEFVEAEADFAVLVKVEEAPVLKIAGEDVTGLLVVGEPVEIVERLAGGVREVEAGGLVLGDEGAGPEEIDEAALQAVVGLDAPFKAGDLAALDAEDREEILVEGLGLALLVGFGLPLLGELSGAVADLFPGEARGDDVAGGGVGAARVCRGCEGWLAPCPAPRDIWEAPARPDQSFFVLSFFQPWGRVVPQFVMQSRSSSDRPLPSSGGGVGFFGSLSAMGYLRGRG